MMQENDPIHTEDALRDATWVAFRLGAQGTREMMARFVEQGGDAVIAGSIRANWNPEWGADPGVPNEDEYAHLRAGFDYGVCVF
jgi:hypothetical protein